MAAEALLELQEILTSRKEPLTRDEAKLVNSLQQDAVRNFGIGATGASIATWFVTRRLNNLMRINLTAVMYFRMPFDKKGVKTEGSQFQMPKYQEGVGFFYGVRRVGKFLDSRAEHILSQHGTRLQSELAEIMLKKYQQHPQVLRRVSKYFFCENVYDDDSTDRPKPRWRFRNLYKEDLASAHMKSDDDSYSKRINSEKTDLRKTDIQRKQINTSAAAVVLEAIEDPFDCIFGPPKSVENTHRPDTVSTPPRMRSRNQKRSHRRHRMHHKENMDV